MRRDWPRRPSSWALATVLAAWLAGAAAAGGEEPLEQTVTAIEDLVGAAAVPGGITANGRVPGVDLTVAELDLVQAIEQRRRRFAKVLFWKTKGCIGESTSGMVALLNRPEGCHSEQAKMMVEAENADRARLYAAVARHIGLDPDGVSRLKAALAPLLRGRARPDDFIQQADGRWVRKAGGEAKR